VHVPQVAGDPGDVHKWTYLSQAFTFSGLAFLVAAARRSSGAWRDGAFVPNPGAIGRWLVAVGFLSLGSRQLLGVPFVLGLVPDWPPGEAVWAMSAAILLLATAVAIVLSREPWPAALLAALLLLFLAVAHLPGLVADPYNADWGAGCKNAILCGGALVLAGAGLKSRGPGR
jgi:uncharacterized membrane protein YphA (DoxX/SURF4 family)